MNRVLSLCLKVFALALCSTLFAAHATEQKSAAADPAKGATLYSGGDPARGITACIACHGAEGNSGIPQNPKLGGQHAAYIKKQLHDFQGPDRNNAIMTMIAKAMTPEDIDNVAAYLATQKATANVAKVKETADLGRKIYRAGIAEKNVPACAGCHSPNGAGIPAQYPRISGQHQDYAVTQLTNFRGGVRNNSAQMVAISKRLTDEEMKAVSDYIAGLR
ncbi:MAG: cytochrome c4 [Burkholderiales bacterium]|jgi:cytochrome c553|nr:cytochrome c4 [Burkholderiales bacterium]